MTVHLEPSGEVLPPDKPISIKDLKEIKTLKKHSIEQSPITPTQTRETLKNLKEIVGEDRSQLLGLLTQLTSPDLNYRTRQEQEADFLTLTLFLDKQRAHADKTGAHEPSSSLIHDLALFARKYGGRLKALHTQSGRNAYQDACNLTQELLDDIKGRAQGIPLFFSLWGLVVSVEKKENDVYGITLYGASERNHSNRSISYEIKGEQVLSSLLSYFPRKSSPETQSQFLDALHQNQYKREEAPQGYRYHASFGASKNDTTPPKSTVIFRARGWRSIQIAADHEKFHPNYFLIHTSELLFASYALAEEWCFLDKEGFEAEQLRTLLEEGAKNLTVAAVSTPAPPLQGAGLELLLRMEKLQATLAARRVQKSYTIEIDKDFPPLPPAFLKPLEKPLPPEPPPPVSGYCLPSLPQEPTNWPFFLAELLKTARETPTPQISLLLIEECVQQLPLPEKALLCSSPEECSLSPWSTLTQKQLIEVIKNLSALMHLYDGGLKQSATAFSLKQMAMIQSLYLLIYDLSIRCDRLDDKPLGLEYYPPYFTWQCSFVDRDPYLAITCKEQYVRYAQVQSYFQTLYKHFFDKENEKPIAPEYLFSSSCRSCLFDLVHFSTPNYIQTESATRDLFCKLSDEYPEASSEEFYIAALNKESESPLFQRRPYLPSLAQAALLVDLTASKQETDVFLSMQANECVLKKDTLCPYRRCFQSSSLALSSHLSRNDQNLLSGYSFCLLDNQPKLDPQKSCSQYNDVKEHPLPSRIFYENPMRIQEALVLTHFSPPQGKSKSATKKFLRNLALPELLPFNLLDHYLTHPDFLDSPAEQELFFISLFRYVTSKQINEVQMCYEANEWRCQGVDAQGEGCEFYKEENAPQWLSLWYAIERPCPLLEALKSESYLQACERFIQLGLQRARDQADPDVQFSRLLFYVRLASTLQPWLPKNHPPFCDVRALLEEMKKKAVSEDSQALIGLHKLYFHLQHAEELSEEELETLLQMWNSPSGQKARAAYPLIEAVALQGLFKAIAGKESLWIRYAPSLLHKRAYAWWEQEPGLFQTLFGEEKFAYVEKEDGYIYFDSSVWGPCRLYLPSRSKKSYLIECQIDGFWYRYVAPSELALEEKLTHGKIPWQALEETAAVPLWICDRRGKKQIALKKEGWLWAEGGDPLQLASIPPDTLTLLNCFEKPEQILSLTQEGRLHCVHLPRYRSLKGESLFFEVKGKKLRAGHCSTFFLTSTPYTGVSYVPHSLHLVDASGKKQKLLIPMRPVASYIPLSREHPIDFESAKDSTKEAPFIFLEYTINKEGKLICKTPEETLYLAYLSLAAREYEQALNYLGAIDPATLSSESHTILRWICALKDTSASGSAVRYQALQLTQDDFSIPERNEIKRNYSNSIIPHSLKTSPKIVDRNSQLIQKCRALVEMECYEEALNTLERVNFLDLSEASANYLGDLISITLMSFSFGLSPLKSQQKETVAEALSLISALFSRIEWLKEEYSKNNRPIPNEFANHLYREFYDKCVKAKGAPPVYQPQAPQSKLTFTLSQETVQLRQKLAEAVSFETHFIPLPQSDPSAPNKIFEMLPIDKQEENFKEVLQRELEDVKEDWKQISSSKATQYQLQHLDKLNKKLEKQYCELLKEKKKLAKQVLGHANHHPTPLLQLMDKAPVLSMKQIVDLFLSQDKEAFLSSNRYLSTTVSELFNEIGNYLILSVETTRLKKACEKTHKLLKKSVISPSDVQKLATLLSHLDTASYDATEYPLFLVFEYLTGMRLRPKQVTLLKRLLEKEADKDQFIPLLVQMIMGGGKTAVLAVLFLRAAARSNRLACFITHSSQFDALFKTLNLKFKEYFDARVTPLNVTREELTPKKWKSLLKELEQTVESGGVLLIKTETAAYLTLELFSTLLRHERFGSPLTKEEIASQMKLLCYLKEHAEVLADEVDLLFNIRQAVNFPVGDSHEIPPHLVQKVKGLFSLLMQEKVTLNGQGDSVNLKEMIRFAQDQQILLTPENWQTIRQAFAYQCVHTLYASVFDETYLESFVRYFSSTIHPRCQRKLDEDSSEVLTGQDLKDFHFLTSLRRLYKSEDKAQREAAQEIALIKYLALEVLPSSLKKVVNYTIGRRRHSNPEFYNPIEVCPYDGAQLPSLNRFGNPWEWLCYQFMVACREAPNEDYIRALVARCKQPPGYEEDFFNMTGEKITVIDDPEKLALLVERLKNDIELRLEVEELVARLTVSSYSCHLSATGIHLFWMFLTMRVMTGTPWNRHFYPKELQSQFEPDKGAEASILHRLTEEVSKEDLHIIEPDMSLEEILDKVLKDHPNLDKVFALLDVGALFKEYSNEAVARALSQRIGKPVLFFEQGLLYCYNTEAPYRVCIGGTSPAEIEAANLRVGDYLIFLDEPRCTGTDIKLPDEAIGLMTLNAQLTSRAYSQTALRLRKLLTSCQHFEYLLPSYLNTSSSDPQEVLVEQVRLFIKNIAYLKAEDYYRACKERISNVFRQQLWSELYAAYRDKPRCNPDPTPIFAPFHELIASLLYLDPYLQFGAIAYEVPTLKELQRHAASQMRLFKGDPEVAKKMQLEIDLILEEAKHSPYLLKTILRTGGEETSALNSEVHLDFNQKLDTDLRVELDGYLNRKESYTQKSIERAPYKRAVMQRFLTRLQGSNPPTSCHQLKDSFGHSLTGRRETDKIGHYTEVFDEDLLYEMHWNDLHNDPLPPFAPEQPPADRLLIFKNEQGEYRLLIIGFQWRHYQRYLREEKPDNLWLMTPQGLPLVDWDTHPPDFNDPGLQRLLVQIHAFNGSINYLIDHEEATQRWLHQDPYFEDRIRVMKLLTRDEDQRELLSTHSLFKVVTAPKDTTSLPALSELPPPPTDGRSSDHIPPSDHISNDPPQHSVLDNEYNISQDSQDLELQPSPEKPLWKRVALTVFAVLLTLAIFSMAALAGLSLCAERFPTLAPYLLELHTFIKPPLTYVALGIAGVYTLAWLGYLLSRMPCCHSS